MNKNIILMILNTLILPFITAAIMTAIDNEYVSDLANPTLPKFPQNVVHNVETVVKSSDTTTNTTTTLFSNSIDSDFD